MRSINIISILFIWINLLGCGEFLDVKPNKKLVVPRTLSDFQAMLDDYNNMVYVPTLGEISSDDYYLNDSDWAGLFQEAERSLYIWERDGVSRYLASEWSKSYKNIYIANVILENLSKIELNNAEKGRWNDIRGQALFLRAKGFLEVVTIWAQAYDEKTAKDVLGIPLRLSSDFNIVSERASLENSYIQIIQDLKESIELLPSSTGQAYRASRPAALGLIARTYLFMRDYENCLIYSNLCLQLKNDLLDFSDLNVNAAYPIPEFNKEIIYQSLLSAGPLNNRITKIDSVLYNSYDSNDLRKSIYFKENVDKSFGFKGSYTSNGVFFSGITVSEIYLMRAECYARLHQMEEAQDDIARLLSNRYKNNKPDEFAFINENDAIKFILQERRKELVYRGVRWPDIKRLNLEGEKINLERKIKNHTYFLSLDDKRFVFPIPDEVISLTDMKNN